MAALLHLPPAASPQALINAAADRSRADAPTIAGLLYEGGGYGSDSDAALVRLADELDRLEREVARR